MLFKRKVYEKNDLHEQLMTQFGCAIKRFSKALDIPLAENTLALDASIQRFEFCYDLCWKTLKKLLLKEGLEVNTPREVFRQAYQLHGLIEENLWLKILTDRNLTSQTYRQDYAVEIYDYVPQYCFAFKELYQKLEKLNSLKNS